MLVAKTLNCLAGRVIKTILCLGLALALSNQVRYFAEQEGILEANPTPDYAISAVYTPSSSGSVHTTVQYCSEIVAAKDPSNSAGLTQTDLTFNDSWFSHDPKDYNHELATTCSTLTAICNSESHYYSDIYGSAAYVEEALVALGFTDVQTNSYEMRCHPLDQVAAFFSGSHDVAAYAFASKEIESFPGSKNTTLIFVGIRGSYGAEWLSNIKMLNNTTSNFDHEGFKKAEEEVKEALEQYIQDVGADPSTVKLLITGHSRGGAIANLLAADFNNNNTAYGNAISSNDVFAYTYASPASTQNENRAASKHNNIFNIINPSDIVCQLPLASWNYGRYGVMVSFPEASDSQFATIHTKMQANHIQNTKYVNPCTSEDLVNLSTFGEKAAKCVPNAESLFTPLGAFAAAQVLCSIDYTKAMYVHYPDSYISWMQALEESDLSFS